MVSMGQEFMESSAGRFQLRSLLRLQSDGGAGKKQWAQSRRGGSVAPGLSARPLRVHPFACCLSDLVLEVISHHFYYCHRFAQVQGGGSIDLLF